MTKTATIKLRLTPKEREEWSGAAGSFEMTLSEWLREVANGSARLAATQRAEDAAKARHAAKKSTPAKKAKVRR